MITNSATADATPIINQKESTLKSLNASSSCTCSSIVVPLACCLDLAFTLALTEYDCSPNAFPILRRGNSCHKGIRSNTVAWMRMRITGIHFDFGIQRLDRAI